MLKANILLNCVCWSIIFALSAWELEFAGRHFVILIFTLTCFTSGSLATLAYDKWLYFPFQFLVIAPLIILTAASGNYILSMIFVWGFLFQLRSYREFHFPLMQRLNQQVELEEANESLVLSQKALINQTVKLIHTSRLAALGEMARGLSHEVNNSLMTVSGMTDLVERTLVKEDLILSKVTQKFVRIREAVTKLSGVVEGLRFFSQEMDSEQKESVKLSTVLDKALFLSHEMLNAHGVRLRISGNTDILIRCRHVQIAQILFTLIQNAYEAQVDEIDRWINVEITSEEDFVYLSISNAGKTMDPEVSLKLFQPFFTTKDIGQSTGVSLSIARGIANEHGGDLYLDRTEEHTTFVVKLPIEWYTYESRSTNSLSSFDN